MSLENLPFKNMEEKEFSDKTKHFTTKIFTPKEMLNDVPQEKEKQYQKKGLTVSNK